MANSSLLGIDSENLPPLHSATGIDSLGPSDASDSGSDSAGAYSDEPDSDTDRFGTGERSSADLSEHSNAQDILPDHIEALDGGADDGSTAEMDSDAERPAPDQRAGTVRTPASGLPRADDMPQDEDLAELEGDDAPDDGAAKN